MHRYLKAIGFGNLKTKKQIKEILQQTETTFTTHELVSLEEDIDFCEFRKEFGSGVGISVCGEMDINEVFEREYYFPYFKGEGITSYADIIVERRIEKDQFVGICEDVKVGVSLIFQLQNGIEYMREKQLGHLPKRSTSVTLSGLATSGTILLPIMKDPELEKERKEESRNRMMLLSAARNGDQAAMESLTLDDMDIYSQVSKRLVTEDVFSIVDTYFMPYGVECDQYAILGEILQIKQIENEVTKEALYVMTLDVNEMKFDVCIPVGDVFGVPAVGRRFKANIWLQGHINF